MSDTGAIAQPYFVAASHLTEPQEYQQHLRLPYLLKPPPQNTQDVATDTDDACTVTKRTASFIGGSRAADTGRLPSSFSHSHVLGINEEPRAASASP